MSALSWLLKLLRPSEQRNSYADQYENRQIDARTDMVGGKAMTPSGGFLDFEGDSEKPRY